MKKKSVSITESNVELPANRAERRRSNGPKRKLRMGITIEERQKRNRKNKIAKESRKRNRG